MSFKENLKNKLEREADPSRRNIAEEADLESRKAHLQLQSDKLGTEAALLNAKSELERKRLEVPYSPSTIIELKSKVDRLEKGLVALTALEAEDFPA